MKKIYIICSFIAVFGFLYVIFINPSLYRYDSVKRGASEVFVRSNRLTGQSMYLSNDNLWIPINNQAPAIVQTVQPTPTLTDALIIQPDPTISEDISKVTISGHNFVNDGFSHDISCTIKNEDSIPHTVKVTATYYDGNNSPIFVLDSEKLTVKPNQLGAITIHNNTAVKNIKNYDLQIKKYVSIFSK